VRQPAWWCGLACVLVLALSAAARGQAMDPVAARQWYENAVKKITDKSTADEIFALAKQCYRNGLTDEAMAHAIEALRKDPNDSRAKYLLFALAPPAETSVIRPGKWAELLPHVDPAKDTLAGTCTMEGGRLVLSASQEAKLMLPVAPAGSYELEVRFARVTGNDSLVIMLPVGSRLVGLFVSALGGQSHDLGQVRGGGPYDKIAVSPGTLENNKPYTVSARVMVRGDQASIETRLDGASLIKWQGPWSDLSPWPDWQLPDSGALGLGAARGRYVVESVRLRMLSGEARLLRPPG